MSRQSRSERRAARAAARGYEPPLMKLPELTDPLRTYNYQKQQLNFHPLRGLWKTIPAGFLVCGGPSLKRLDLEPLKRRGIVSMGINNVAGFAPVRAMTFSDPPEKFHHGIHLDPTIMKFVPISKLGKRVRAKKPDGTFAFTALNVRDCPNVFGYSRDSEWMPEEFFTRESATWGCGASCETRTGHPKVLFTFFLGLRLLHYLGLRRVYLLGADFAMLSGETGGYAFDQARTKDAASGNNNSYHVASAMCDELKPTFEKDGFEVFNCFRESGLTTFDYVSYEDALNYCLTVMPSEPYDLQGWYEKPGAKEDDRGTE